MTSFYFVRIWLLWFIARVSYTLAFHASYVESTRCKYGIILSGFTTQSEGFSLLFFDMIRCFDVDVLPCCCYCRVRCSRCFFLQIRTTNGESLRLILLQQIQLVRRQRRNVSFGFDLEINYMNSSIQVEQICFGAHSWACCRKHASVDVSSEYLWILRRMDCVCCHGVCVQYVRRVKRYDYCGFHSLSLLSTIFIWSQW